MCKKRPGRIIPALKTRIKGTQPHMAAIHCGKSAHAVMVSNLAASFWEDAGILLRYQRIA
jgi:hypothetical protein